MKTFPNIHHFQAQTKTKLYFSGYHVPFNISWLMSHFSTLLPTLFLERIVCHLHRHCFTSHAKWAPHCHTPLKPTNRVRPDNSTGHPSVPVLFGPSTSTQLTTASFPKLSFLAFIMTSAFSPSSMKAFFHPSLQTISPKPQSPFHLES